MPAQASSGIGTLGEKSLHAALKAWCARPGDQHEVGVDGYVIDLVRGDLLIEIQTGSFSAIKRKLTRLLDDHPIRLVHPIAREKWIVRLAADGQTTRSRRKSPARGRVEDLFKELVRLPTLVTHDHLALEVLLIQEEVVLIDDGQGSWRRKGWSIHDRRLLDVLSSTVFHAPADFLTLLPADLPDPFTTRELSEALGLRINLAQKMAYCLYQMGAVERVGKRGRAYLYEVGESNGDAGEP